MSNFSRPFILSPKNSFSHDVIVVGGSLGGVLIAVGLARGGKKVLLVEKRGFLGGALCAGLLPYFPDHSECELLSEIRTKLEAAGYIHPTGRFHMEGLKVALEELVLETPNIELRYHLDALAPQLQDGQISGILAHCKNGITHLQAGSYVDATQNFDLARLCIEEEADSPEHLFHTGRMRIGGCTYVAAEAPIVPSFNNFSVYFPNGNRNEKQVQGALSKLKLGLEQDPFTEVIPPKVAELVGAQVRIRRLFHNRDRLVEFTYASVATEDEHVRFRKLAWKILNFWKENTQGFEDAYLCHSAPELDKWGIRLPALVRAPELRAGEGTLLRQDICSGRNNHYAGFREENVELACQNGTFRALQIGNLWLPGDSRFILQDHALGQVSFPALSTRWADSVSSDIMKEPHGFPRKTGKATMEVNPRNLPEADVVIIGGGPSGAAAAIAAARHGAKVVLVEHSYDLGGNGTTGGVTSFAGGSRGGIYEEVLSELHKSKYKFPDNQAFDPEGYRHVLDELLSTSGVDVRLGATLVQARREGRIIHSILIRQRDRFLEIPTRFFIDASGDAELSHLADVSTVVGREKDGKTQPVSLMYQIANDGEGPHLRWFWRIPHGRYLVNATRVAALGIDNGDLTRAEIEGRKQMRLQVDGLRKHFGYRLVHSGPRVGIRETRRIVGHYTLTVEDARAGRHFEDAIGKCNYFLDIHNPDGTTGTFAENVPTYDIPFRSLIPQGVDNLLVAGRCISMTHEAMASLRVMPPCFVIGQAAGTAAALCLHAGVPPDKIPVRMLQSVLANDGVDLSR